MGCASSKQKRCKHCKTPYSPVRRSYSMHVIHPPQQKGDSYHVVALTSTTLGSISLDSSSQNGNNVVNNSANSINVFDGKEKDNMFANGKELDCREEFSLGLLEAKSWSDKIQQKIPRTPNMTPPGEPETINTWEMMDGLEDVSPLYRFRSFSFDVSSDTVAVPDSPKLTPKQNGTVSPNNKPITAKFADEEANSCVLQQNETISCVLQQNETIWAQVAEEEADSVCDELDPEVITTFRKSLEELSPSHPFYLNPISEEEKQQSPLVGGNDVVLEVSGDVKKVHFIAKDYKCAKDKVVVYFTSLRGVRKTYEDCCHVRVILKGLGVRVDERDVSMHSGFKEELRELMGEGFSSGRLPRVFIGRKYIGGADEIRRMNEDGQLEKVFEGCEMLDDGGGGFCGACEACGDLRFVPCETCSGSCKIYCEAAEDEDHELEEGEESCEYGFRRCPDCNENGLIRCPICCD